MYYIISIMYNIYVHIIIYLICYLHYICYTYCKLKNAIVNYLRKIRKNINTKIVRKYITKI